MYPLKKIISGGQTGVDRAALDVALQYHIPHGGWCPKGRKAEDRVIAPIYQLQETESEDYSERTRLNIEDSDGTLIIVNNLPLQVKDGTQLTLDLLQEKRKKYFVYEIEKHLAIEKIVQWIKYNEIKILNIAGPRESSYPGIYRLSFKVIDKVISCYIEE